MPKQKDEFQDQYEKAKAAGHYMAAIWYVEADKLQLFRLTHDFPFVDIPEALKLLQENLEPITIKRE